MLVPSRALILSGKEVNELSFLCVFFCVFPLPYIFFMGMFMMPVLAFARAFSLFVLIEHVPLGHRIHDRLI